MICRSVIRVARFEVKWGSFDYWMVLSGELGMLCFFSKAPDITPAYITGMLCGLFCESIA
jgi:hypothetical protein